MRLLRPEWLVPPNNLLLRDLLLDGAVHIWRSSLIATPEQLATLTKLLSPDEVARSQRFRFPQHQQRFVVGRATLRLLLARYTNASPDRLQFQYSATGKPGLVDPAGLQFNLSHAQDWMLCAVDQDQLVGIDLEQLRPMKDVEQLTQRFFAPQESRRICALPEPTRSRLFFQHWTCKEAILKATGTGLANLGDVELVEGSGGLQLARSLAGVAHLQSFEPAENFVAAVAVGAAPVMSFWQGDWVTIGFKGQPCIEDGIC